MLLSCFLNIQKNKGYFSSWGLALGYGCLFLFVQALQPVYAEEYSANDLYEYVKLNQNLPDFAEDLSVMTEEYGQTALHLAVENDDVNSAWVLLASDADVRRAKYLTEKHVGSVLHQVKSARAARLLLEHDADINSQEIFDRTTPLLQAVLRQDKDLVEFLLAQGADANTGAVRENDGWFFAAENTVYFLLEAPLFPLEPIFRYPWTIPQVTVRAANILVFGSIFLAFLDRIGQLDNMPVVLVGGLAVAVFSRRLGWILAAHVSKDIAEYIGRDKDIIHRIKHELSKLNIPPVKAKQLPILAAIELKDNEVIDMLLEHDVDLNVTNKELIGVLAQVIITYQDDENAGIELMQHLIENGADVNKKHKDLFAVRHRWFFEGDSSSSRVDYDSALDLARQLKCNKMANFLLEQGALDIEPIEQASQPDTQGQIEHKTRNDRLKPKAYRRSVRDVKSRRPVFTAPRIAPVKPNWVPLR